MSWSGTQKVNRDCEICGKEYDELTQYDWQEIRHDGRGITVDVYLELEAIKYNNHDGEDYCRCPDVCNKCHGRMLIQFGEELITGDKNNVN